jgi:hypothetical protein
VLGVGSDGFQRFGRGLEENVVDPFLVLVGDRGDLFRYGEHDMEILAVEQFGLAVFDPLRPRQRLAFRTVAVPAAVETVPLTPTLIAAFEVAAQGRRAAHLDCCHDAPLRRGHRRAMLFPIGCAVAAEDIRHLQLRAIHRPAAQYH